MSRLLALALFLTLLARPAAAQDAIDRIADALELSDDQVLIVEDVFQPGDAGSVWTLLAELHPTLTNAQRETLLARRERPAGARAGQGRRGGRGQRGGRRGRSDAERAAERAARDAALGLDADQSAALDAAFAARREGGRGAALVLPESLSAEQAEMIQMQRGLIRLALRRGRR